MKRALGNWVTGDRFWDRKEELDLFMEYLTDGANVLLSAPRRIGKTSLMREAALRLEGEFVCLQIDLQKCQSAPDAIAELSAATRSSLPLWSKVNAIFSDVFDRLAGKVESLQLEEIKINLRSGLTGSDWQQRGDSVLEALAGSEHPVILFMDEVPILVNRILQGSDYKVTEERRQQTDAFMSWLRENTIRHQQRLRIVVTGSIGLEPILRSAGLNATLNTFTPFFLRAWPPDVAREFLATISRDCGVKITDAAISRIVERLGYCIPHYVQVFFDSVYKARKLANVSEVDPSFVDEVYESQMLSVQGHAELSHLEERLKTVLGPELFPLALELLTEVFMTGELTDSAVEIIARGYSFDGRSCADAVREVLGILEHDLYIERQEHRFRPVSKLVTDWWKARFSFGYKPALSRKEKVS